ncbi:MAG: T9SS type A sorting domain-containing protein [Bacteroidales bacterium]|nr:T9SS type A sorting domain-containing protein [Bacteroidales bacterium]
MKRLIFILFAMFSVFSVYGQVKQEVIASAGGYNTGGNLSISWTLGETIIPTFQNGNLILTHGFQQQLIITSVEENIDILVNIKVFPNPASDNLNIRFEEPIDGEVVITIIDSQGRLIKTETIEATTTEKQISLQELGGGVYFLRMTKGKLVNVYKVVKL